MSLASDQQIAPVNPSRLGEKMLELQELVFEEWERRVRASVTGAATLSPPVIINTLPALYKNLVEALSPDYPRTSAGVGTPSVASEHGGERARLTAYRAESVISEYQILRETLVDVLRKNQVPITDKELQIIFSAIDACIRESATAFTLAHSAFREQFVATVVHDLRTPLSVAFNSAELIKRLDPGEKISDLAEKIRTSLRRIDDMARQVLDTVKIDSGARLSFEITSFDIGEVVREVAEAFKFAGAPPVEISGTSVIGWWGRDLMRRVLENMVSNAIKHGSGDEVIRIAYVEDHGRLQLSVHNKGAVIPPDQIECIFQVFRRAAVKDDGAPSWGIGLPFVRSVAESHGGSIDVDSSEERGTTFAVDIPLDARPFKDAPVLPS
jgi:signal transduction histidine kinase